VSDIVLGLLAIVIGAAFCFRGYLALQIVIPIWGALAGFSAGAGLIAGITGDGFLSTTLGWIVGIITAVVFAVLAYLFYAVAVVIAMGAIGFMIGTSVLYALDVDWQWLVVLVGIAVGVLLAVLAIVADLPMIVLVVLSAIGGASAVVGGLMLVFGAVDTGDFDGDVMHRADHGWWWYTIYVVLVVAGIMLQVRAAERMKMSVRDAWETDRSDTPA
jgi:hypothetical protein